MKATTKLAGNLIGELKEENQQLKNKLLMIENYVNQKEFSIEVLKKMF